MTCALNDGQDRRRLDLDFRLCLDERGHLDHGHRGEMAAEHGSISGADRSHVLQIFAPAGHEPGEAHQVFRPPARLLEHPHDVAQGDAYLPCER